MTIQSRVPFADYTKIHAVNISSLKDLRRSALHYRHRLVRPRTTAPMTLGTAAHVATLEPERFEAQFAVWDSRTESGNLRPRNGKLYDAFVEANPGKMILTATEAAEARAIAEAVRSDPTAMRYLETGDPEVTLEWSLGGRACKGRVDWLTTIDGQPVIVGLKTARDCRPFPFGAAAAKLGYHLQWAWYFDGFARLKGVHAKVVEIVVESEAPHAVATYVVPLDVLDQGRDEYRALLAELDACERSNEWPGPVTGEQVLTLPSWVYGPGDGDDLGDLGLEMPAEPAA